MKTALLSLVLLALSNSVFAASETAAMCGPTSADVSATDASTLDLKADLAAFPYYWYPLGCVRFPGECLDRARFQGFYFWQAVQDPFQCGYYGLACYGRY